MLPCHVLCHNMLRNLTPGVALQVTEMRVDMIRGSMAAPESMMRILSDYPMQVWEAWKCGSMESVGAGAHQGLQTGAKLGRRQQPAWHGSVWKQSQCLFG